jgi:hypothetical protein
MRVPQLVLFALLSMSPALASAQATPFDGSWNITMTCPPHPDDDDTKGYTHRFPAEVVNGELRATHGAEGEPGWHFLRGHIKAGGSANLRLDGIVNNEKYAINNAQRGKAYTYRVKAQFEPASGTGQRLTGRVCEFRFVR